MDIAQIISIVSLAINITALVLVLIGVLLGIKRGLIHSLLRLTAAVFALFTSILAARYLRGSVYGMIEGLLANSEEFKAFMEDPTMLELTAASPTAAQLIKELPAALLAPILFLAAFLVLNLVFYGIYKIFKRMTVKTKELCSKTAPGRWQLGRLSGALVSATASALIVIAFFAPFSGYLSFADEILNEVESVEIDESIDKTILEIDEVYLTPIRENPVFTVSGTLLNPIVFDSVTSCKIDDYTVVWSDEIGYLAGLYGSLKPLLDTGFDLGQFSDKEAAALRDFGDKFDDSKLVPHLIADFMPAMASKWNAGEPFLGIENPATTAPEQLQPMMHSLVDVLETTTYETLAEDVGTLTELLATLAESGTLSMLGNDISAQDIVKTLSKDGLISGLIDTLYANPRMQVLVTDIANLGFDAISASLEIPKDDESVRKSLSDALNEAVKNSESITDYDQRITALSNDINGIFAKYGVESDKAMTTLYAECIVAIGPIETEDRNAAMNDYFTIINSALIDEMATATLPAPVFTNLPVNAKVKEAVTAYLATAGNDAAKNAAKLANEIRGSEALEHAIITLEDIHLSAEEMKAMSAEDIHKQSESLEEIIRVLSNVMVFDESGAFSIDIAKLDPNALAEALFHLASTGTDEDGHEIHNIAHAITGVVKYSLYKVGIDARAASNLVNHMTTERPDGHNKNPLTSALAVLNVVQSDKEMTAEDIKENITTLVQDLDKDTAKVLADCISPNLINSFAPSTLPSDQTEALVNVTKDIVTNFGEMAEDLTPEQLEAESAYMQTIFDLAVNAGGEREDNLFSTGEEGASSTLDMTADDFVETIKHSTIISTTVINETEALKTAVNDAMPEGDKEQLLTAIEKDTELPEDLKSALLDVFQLNNLGNIGK